MQKINNIIGSKIIVLDKTESTNAYLFNLLKSGANVNEGMVVCTYEQSAGRGLGTNQWESEAGSNITMSFFIKPDFIGASDNFFISMFISLAVLDFAKHYIGKYISIKWPNDIYFKNKKLSGILIENTIENNKIKCCIAGIGININQENFFSNAPNPISLKNITGTNYDIKSCLNLLCTFLNKRYQELSSKTYIAIKNEYLSNLYAYNIPAEYLRNKKKFKGKIVDVSSFGHLIILEESGNSRSYEMKEIQFIIPEMNE